LQRYEEALAAYEDALATTPDDPQAFAGAVDCALTVCDWERTERFAAELPDRIARAAPMAAPFRLLALTGDPGLQRRGAELYVVRTVGVPTPAGSTPSPHPTRRIRVGYLSAQFMAHAGASLIAELLDAMTALDSRRSVSHCVPTMQASCAGGCAPPSTCS
jgi:protein O-GlcNAc transferase